VGLEEEFLLVDATSGVPLPKSAEVAKAAARLGVDIQLELSQAQLEINTSVCDTSDEVRTELLHLRSVLAAGAREVGGIVLAVATAPVGAIDQVVTDKPRYQRIGQRYPALAREQPVCGCHVHVAVPDRDTAVRASNHLRPWLPTLLALTANSPIYHGMDTEFASWRWVQWSRWPCFGPPPYFRSSAHYDAMVAMLLETGAILDEGMVYWDVRPSRHLPTVEIRVSDVPATAEESVLLATLIRALVMTAVDDGGPGPQIDAEVLRAAYWLASRGGLTAPGLDVMTAQRVDVDEMLRRLIAHSRNALEELGEYDAVRATVRAVFARGNGAIRQRRAFRQGDIGDVIALAAEDTLAKWTA
jgi:carboxylate-amine ligase